MSKTCLRPHFHGEKLSGVEGFLAHLSYPGLAKLSYIQGYLTADSGAVNIPTLAIFQKHAYNFFLFFKEGHWPTGLQKDAKG